jgi:uncharacterized membrane protein YidH (DUF202 family)
LFFVQQIEGSLKMLESRLTRHELKWREAIAVVLILLGLATCVGGLVLWIISARSLFDSSVTMILGILFLAVGILIFITEMFESWLSHGQAALVDGLQAG